MSLSGMSLAITAGGSALVRDSPIEKGWSITRAESFRACLVLMVPYVTIMVTRSSPYLRVT